MHVIYASDNYIVVNRHTGLEIVRLTDRASTWVQGDDADTLECELDQHEAAWTNHDSEFGAWLEPDGDAQFCAQVDYLLSHYFTDERARP